MSAQMRNCQAERVASIEIIISTMLRVGVISSLSIVVIGTIVSFVHHPEYLANPAELQRLTRVDTAFPHTIKDVVAGVRAFEGRAIVMVGLLLLIATPVARVAVSTLAFVYEGDRKFTIITIAVLILLLTSFLIGKAGG